MKSSFFFKRAKNPTHLNFMTALLLLFDVSFIFPRTTTYSSLRLCFYYGFLPWVLCVFYTRINVFIYCVWTIENPYDIDSNDSDDDEWRILDIGWWAGLFRWEFVNWGWFTLLSPPTSDTRSIIKQMYKKIVWATSHSLLKESVLWRDEKLLGLELRIECQEWDFTLLVSF